MLKKSVNKIVCGKMEVKFKFFNKFSTEKNLIKLIN